LSVLLSFFHCGFFSSVFLPLCFLSFFILVHNGQKTEEQTTQWPKDRRTDNTMAKRQKDRQHNGQKTEGQTTQ
jgi:hypothetical protein